MGSLKIKIKQIAKKGTKSLQNCCSICSIPLNKNNLKIVKLKNSHKGERCFIIGNGTSLRPEDLDKLKGEFTFACNKIYRIFNETTWRPNIFIIVDPTIARENFKEINEIKLDKVFTIQGYSNIKADIYFKNNADIFKTNAAKFSKNFLHCLYAGATVVYHTLQIAYYMGFKEVYLLGVDYSYPNRYTKKGPLQIEQSNHIIDMRNLYFSKDYISGQESNIQPNPYIMYIAYEKAKQVFEENGRKILNASRTTYLDVYDRVDLDEIIKTEKERKWKELNGQLS